MPSFKENAYNTTTSPTISKKRRRAESSTSGDVQMKQSLSPRHAHIPIFQSETFRQIHHDQWRMEDKLEVMERKLLPMKGPRGGHDSKRMRVSLSAEDLAVTAGGIPVHPETEVLGDNQGNGSTRKAVDISPCHICHRKPTQKNELDSYGYCDGCGERTCWICFRECAGSGGATPGREDLEIMVCEDGSLRRDQGEERPWEKGRIEGHRSMVCSRCCVERGTEGEVYCLGCLAGEKAG